MTIREYLRGEVSAGDETALQSDMEPIGLLPVGSLAEASRVN